MNHDMERRRGLLKKLAKLIAELALEDDDDDVEDGNLAVCTPKMLPDSLQARAAKTAVHYNPLNAPLALGALRTIETNGDVMSPARIAVEVSKYWGPAQRTLTVSFMEQTSGGLRNKILSHLNAWNKTAGISFQYVPQGGNVRITRAEKGFWSYLGTDILHIHPNRATMCLSQFTENTPEKEYRRVVRHEAGHTLGFPHEHMRQELVSRLDRQKVYDYFRRHQGWDRQMVDSQVLTPLEKKSIYATPADETSIMCYQMPGSLTKDGQPIVGGEDINRTDYWFAGSIYPKPGASSSPGARLAALDGDTPEHAAQAALAEEDESGFTAEPLEL